MCPRNASIEGTEQPCQYEIQVDSPAAEQEVDGGTGGIDELAARVNLQLWQLVLKLHALLEAAPDEAPRILVGAGVLLRMDEMGALKTAIKRMQQ